MRSSVLAPLAVAVALVGLAGCGGDSGSGGSGAAADEAPKTPPLEAAYDTCSTRLDGAMQEAYEEDAPDIGQMFVLADEGQSLTVATPDPGGELMSAAALMGATCVLTETGAPSTIATSMGSASALSGRQSESYDGVDVDWSYAAGMGNAGFLATFVAQ